MIDNKTMIPIVNKRGSAYTATLRNGEYYEWMPSKDGFEDMNELTFRDVQLLHTTSATFRDGYLFVDHEEARKRLGLEREDIKKNQISREEIEKVLKGTLPGMKKAFGKIDNQSLLREIIDVAKELKVDNVPKLQFLSQISGIPMEILIDSER